MKIKSIIFSILTLTSLAGLGQETFPSNGPRNTVHNNYVFKNANVVTSSGNVLNKATMIVRDEKIVAVGNQVEIPKNSVIYDLNGMWIYPSFIELDADYGLPKNSRGSSDNSQRRIQPPQINSNKTGAFSWNESIHPESDASQDFHVDKKAASDLRRKGFGLVLSHQHDGIMRGTSVLVNTGEEPDNLTVIKSNSAQHYSFSKGSSKQTYPSSLMGTIALIRQTLYDAQWYENHPEKEELNYSLEAINKHKALPIIFEVEDHLSVLRAYKISEEFQTNFIVRGSGDEYRRAASIKKTNQQLIIPIQLPLPYNVAGSFDAVDLSLEKMKHWELAPFNAVILKEQGVEFALTAKGLSDKDFWNYLSKLKSTGLSDSDIIKSLTETPAKMIRMDTEIGKLMPGYLANFFICSGPVFNEKTIVVENWVNGKQYIVNDRKIDIRGEYNLNVNKNSGLRLVVDGDFSKPEAKVIGENKTYKAELKHNANEVSLRYNEGDAKNPTYVLLSGSISDRDSRIWVGKGQLTDGNWVDWAAIRQKEFVENDTSKKNQDSIIRPLINYPLGAFGFDTLPLEETVLFKHATVWTNEAEGILQDADVCISNGKILAVGQGLNKQSLFGNTAVNLKIVEAKGKHITAGIIDEHSHIAISKGVNEGGQAISSEVRIGDVIDCDDINIYRQLSGGVTASQLLHGSANPIGGQSGIVKLRWGFLPEEMKVEGAVEFIKFALGENVKQSNWGDMVRTRYPQTRMGVEQTFYDGFYRAKEYSEIWKIHDAGLKSIKGKKEVPQLPRKDLELDALVEILNGKRFITCHSYVQSEITMLMSVADSMKFRVNTFTHILEGYKVADKMKAHGVGGSTFSDWWAYKFEVNDAIPYNAAIMHHQGIVTAINSDDAEMGRRLNQEAAKTVKYGGVSEEEALKMVTLNPAKLLHLDHRMGSIKVGKDADLVMWSAHPLSLNAIAQQTYVDGKCMFDVKRDKEMREKMKTDRSRLVQKMISESGEKGKSKKVEAEKNHVYHCEDLIE